MVVRIVAICGRRAKVRAQELGVTPEHRQLVHTAFTTIHPFADAVGVLFYSRLFELDPALRGLFPHDLANQAHSVMAMLQLVLDGLDAPVELARALHNLGERHRAYGIQLQHYATVHQALVWTFRHVLGPACTPAMVAALRALFTMISDGMQGITPSHDA